MQYRIVTHDGTQGFCPLHVLDQAIQSYSKPTSFFHHHVRYLFLFRELDVLPSLTVMKLRRLALDWPIDIDPRRPMFTVLTLLRYTVYFR